MTAIHGYARQCNHEPVLTVTNSDSGTTLAVGWPSRTGGSDGDDRGWHFR
jgi:hypothetical protein